MLAVAKSATLSGTIRTPASKSEAHRLLICAALGDKPCTLTLSSNSEDIEATARCLRALGAGIEACGTALTITPVSRPPEKALLDCGESGSTLRFMLPVAAALGCNARFVGSGRLPERPLGALTEALSTHGISFSSDRLPFEISGKLTGGEFSLPGNISSQYISGVLLALPLTDEGGHISLTTPLESSAYVTMTTDTMARFGITADGLSVAAGSRYCSPPHIEAFGDWSGAAFFLAAGALSGEITLTRLDPDSAQPDRKIADILSQMGARVETGDRSITVAPAPLHAVTVDLREIPDLLPILTVIACFAQGESRFVNGARLRLKESDRLTAAAQLVRSLGGAVVEGDDYLTIYGSPLTGGRVDGFGDHRIVMSAAIAALRCTNEVIITDALAVAKSYPGFYDDYKLLGGIINLNLED